MIPIKDYPKLFKQWAVYHNDMAVVMYAFADIEICETTIYDTPTNK